MYISDVTYNLSQATVTSASITKKIKVYEGIDCCSWVACDGQDRIFSTIIKSHAIWKLLCHYLRINFHIKALS